MEKVAEVTMISLPEAVFKAINAEPKPLMLVLECKEPLPEYEVDQLLGAWETAFAGKPPIPLFILPPDTELKLVVRPDAEVV